MTTATGVLASPIAGADDDANCGLRERKKRETRRAIHRAAIELAHQDGVDGLTVDAIAERAGVSPRTFFNYFANKDDAIIGSGSDDLSALVESVAARPRSESPREVILGIALDRVAHLLRDPQTWAMRRELTLREPALGLRFLGVYARADHALVAAIVERERARGPLTPEGELAVEVEAYAALGAFRAAVRAHLSGAHDTPLAGLVERAFRCL